MRSAITPQQKAALLGTAPAVPAGTVPADPLQSFMTKYDLNNPVKRTLLAVGLVGAFMGVLKAKSLFT